MKKKNIVLRKISWTLFFMFLYLLGTHIRFLEDVTDSRFENLANSQLLKFASSVTGGNLDSLNLFSIGIWPWMTTLILWRVITMVKIFNIGKVVKVRADKIQMLISLLLSIIQGWSLTLNFDLEKSLIPFRSILEAQIILTLFLTTGCFILIWLGNLNAVLGIGGPTIIILAGMILNWPKEIVTFFLLGYYKEDHIYAAIVVFIMILSGVVIYMTLLTELAEYRIKVNRIMINNNLSNKAYMPIKLNPAGAMPIMYSLALLAIPQYLLLGLRYVFPGNKVIEFISGHLVIYDNFGITVYIVLLFLLALGFAFVNVSPEDLAESMQKSGDYIDGVRPGIETKRYLNSIVLKFAFVGGVFMCLFTGTPYYLVNIKTGITGLLMFPGSIFMFTTFIINMIDEVNTLRIRNKYKNLFD